MREFTKDKWNIVLLVLALILCIELVVFIQVRSKPCGYSPQVIPGANFNQPYPVYCGNVPKVGWTQ